MLRGCKGMFYRWLPFVFPCLIFIKMPICSLFSVCVWVKTKYFKSNTFVCACHWLWYRAQCTPGRAAEPEQSTKRTFICALSRKRNRELACFVFMVLQKLEHSCFSLNSWKRFLWFLAEQRFFWIHKILEMPNMHPLCVLVWVFKISA